MGSPARSGAARSRIRRRTFRAPRRRVERGGRFGVRRGIAAFVFFFVGAPPAAPGKEKEKESGDTSPHSKTPTPLANCHDREPQASALAWGSRLNETQR